MAMNGEFARELAKQMDYFSNDASADKLSSVQKDIDDVKNVMVGNIGAYCIFRCFYILYCILAEKVLDRQEKIGLLVRLCVLCVRARAVF